MQWCAIIRSMTYLNRTIRLLNETTLTPQQVADACGLGVRFMYMLKNNEIADPSVNKVEKVYLYLLEQQRSLN